MSLNASETIGLDLYDQTGLYVVINELGEVVREGKVILTRAGVERVFGAASPWR